MAEECWFGSLQRVLPLWPIPFLPCSILYALAVVPYTFGVVTTPCRHAGRGGRAEGPPFPLPALPRPIRPALPFRDAALAPPFQAADRIGAGDRPQTPVLPGTPRLPPPRVRELATRLSRTAFLVPFRRAAVAATRADVVEAVAESIRPPARETGRPRHVERGVGTTSSLLSFCRTRRRFLREAALRLVGFLHGVHPETPLSPAVDDTVRPLLRRRARRLRDTGPPSPPPAVADAGDDTGDASSKDAPADTDSTGYTRTKGRSRPT